MSDAIKRILGLQKLEGLTEGEWFSRIIMQARSSELAEAGGKIAAQMIRQIDVQNAKDWRQASRKSQRSQFLYRLLREEMAGPVGQRFQQLVRENAGLISSIPFTAAQHLTTEIAEAQQAGSRPEAVAKMMQQRFPELVDNRIKLIARTETSKASTGLTRARSESLGLDWFEWKSAEDFRVRPAHKNLNGVLVSWNDLPSPEELMKIRSTLGHYAPGDAPNCRCYPAPLLSIDDAYSTGSERRRVYTNGRIQRMTRAQFARLSHLNTRFAA